MKSLMKNKKGTLVLRDLIFMLIMFAGIMALAAVFVLDMADEYENTAMRSEFTSSGVGSIGSNLLDNELDPTMESMETNLGNGTDSLIGSFTSVTGAIKGAASILTAVLSVPTWIADSMTTMMTALGVPGRLPEIIGIVITLTIWGVIIFAIMSALLKGGKV